MNYLQSVHLGRFLQKKAKEIKDLKRKLSKQDKRMKEKYGDKWTSSIAAPSKKDLHN